MKKIKTLLVILGLLGISGVLMGGACEDVTEAASCGPCGRVAMGDATISGDARLDGLFKAFGTIGIRTQAIRANFDANVKALGEAFGVASIDGHVDAKFVADVKAAIEAEINANVSGGLKINYEPPKCSAEVNVAIEAKAQCEAKVDASCSASVECDPGQLSFQCSGKCEGSCSAGCEVPTCTVEVSGPELACEGECQGSCATELKVAAACEGKCEGECSGNCSAYVDNGSGGYDCAGTCDGTCQGKCEVSGSASASCSGECRGSCKLTGTTAETNCKGELKCEGECTGECSGGCEGEISAPKCNGEASCDVEASAECEASASAQASAEVQCSPPSLEVGWDFAASVDAQAQASFLAKMDVFKVKMTAILQGFAEIKGLIEGYGEGDAHVQAPILTIRDELAGIGEAALTGDFNVAVPLIPCTLDAFGEIPGLVTQITGDAEATISGSAELLLIITG